MTAFYSSEREDREALRDHARLVNELSLLHIKLQNNELCHKLHPDDVVLLLKGRMRVREELITKYEGNVRPMPE